MMVVVLLKIRWRRVEGNSRLTADDNIVMANTNDRTTINVEPAPVGVETFVNVMFADSRNNTVQDAYCETDSRCVLHQCNTVYQC